MFIKLTMNNNEVHIAHHRIVALIDLRNFENFLEDNSQPELITGVSIDQGSTDNIAVKESIEEIKALIRQLTH